MKLNQELFAIVNQNDEIESEWGEPYIDEDRDYLDSQLSKGDRIVKIKIVPVDKP